MFNVKHAHENVKPINSNRKYDEFILLQNSEGFTNFMQVFLISPNHRRVTSS